MLWKRAEPQETVTVDKALDCVFARTRYRDLAEDVFSWLKERLPYRCGVRLGKGRISFLVGNYRPAAIKRDKAGVRVDMGFTGGLPGAFKVASDVWKSIDAEEGYVVVQQMPLPLSSADVDRFVLACRQMRIAALKTGARCCNVIVDWPESKPSP